jgi:hypothetical protein
MVKRRFANSLHILRLIKHSLPARNAAKLPEPTRADKSTFSLLGSDVSTVIR